jgi:hypothetical protein
LVFYPIRGRSAIRQSALLWLRPRELDFLSSFLQTLISVALYMVEGVETEVKSKGAEDKRKALGKDVTLFSSESGTSCP